MPCSYNTGFTRLIPHGICATERCCHAKIHDIFPFHDDNIGEFWQDCREGPHRRLVDPNERVSQIMQSFRISRRVFAQSIGAIPIASLIATDADAQSREVTELLAALTDLIVPRDEGPSASDLKVHVSIVSNAKTIPNYPQLLSEGLGWLEMRARQVHQVPFLTLAQDLQADILGEAFAAKAMTLPFVFAHRIREDVLSHYYRDARAWVGLGFYRPIQPNGYPDFLDPPA